MTKATWSKEEFKNWIERNGLRTVDAADVLRLSKTSVLRIKSGAQGLTRSIQALAELFEERRIVADHIDNMAASADLAEKCRDTVYGVVTGVSAAAMRGWTSASTNYWFMAMPGEHLANFEVPDTLETLACDQLPDRVEVRKDVDGNWYRLADPVRTVVDAVRDDTRQVKFHVEEIVRAAVEDGVSTKDMIAFAEKQGPEALARMNHYLGLITGGEKAA